MEDQWNCFQVSVCTSST